MFSLKVRLHRTHSIAKRRLATQVVAHITVLAQIRPTIHQQFCLSEVKQPLAKLATGCNLSQIEDDVKFWLLRVWCKHTLRHRTNFKMFSKKYHIKSIQFNVYYIKLRLKSKIPSSATVP